jgi:hypothetical protein
MNLSYQQTDKFPTSGVLRKKKTKFPTPGMRITIIDHSDDSLKGKRRYGTSPFLSLTQQQFP